MIDVRILRENPELVRESLRKRGMDASLADRALQLDREWRRILKEVQDLRALRNRLSVEIGKVKRAGGDPSPYLAQVKEVTTRLQELEAELREVEEARYAALKSLPNLVLEDVPVCFSDEENVPIRFWGRARVWKGHLDQFMALTDGRMEWEEIGWRPKSHVDLLPALGLANYAKASEVAGARFYYLLRDLAVMDLALQLFALKRLTEKGYTPVFPPLMLKRKILDGVLDLETFEDMIYKIQDEDLYLIGTAEHPLAALHTGEILDEKELPLKYVGWSPCFRREAGAHGKDTKGIFRVHHFNKVEQFVFSLPEQSREIHEEIVRNAEELLRELGIPYRVVNVCSGSLGAPAAKKYDVEAWMPAQGTFRELISVSNDLDWQARRLMIRYRVRKTGEFRYVHTLNGTALATTRTMVAIVENFQREDGSIEVPKPLRDIIGKDVIPGGT